jgi:hypothetical protein
MRLKKFGMNTICELPHQTFLHTHRKLVQTLHWALSMHKNIRMFKKLPLLMSSSRKRGYNLLHPLFLPEHGITPTHSINSYKIQT